MSDEINRTSSASSQDYAKTLRPLSDTALATAADTNFWCWKSLQLQEIDYHARYLACVELIQQRTRS